MARIRTVKPELFRHEELFELEQSTGLPIRVSFIALFTVCDREGRFKWRPRQLKLDCLPYDEIDFSRVLDALRTRGFVRKYTISGVEYGCIPSFTAHQVINNRESASQIPSIDESDAETDEKAEIPADSGENNEEVEESSRVPDASSTRHDLAQGEREGKGREKEGEREYVSANAALAEDTGLRKQVVEKPKRKKSEYSDEFEYAFSIYPEREGDNPKKKAFSAWNARLKEGATAEEMISGIKRYSAFCDAKGDTGTTYVKHTATFLGPDKHFQSTWKQKSPASGVNRMQGSKQPMQFPDYSSIWEEQGNFIDSTAKVIN